MNFFVLSGVVILIYIVLSILYFSMLYIDIYHLEFIVHHIDNIV